MLKNIAKFKWKIDELRNLAEEYKNGNISKEIFKSYRVPMGIYEERKENSYMVRPRTPAGVISLFQLNEINKIAEKYAQGELHFTTRQGIQFHKVEFDNIMRILEELYKIGLITVGTGGNTPRNVVSAPLSGTEKNEIFDTTPYALKTTEYIINDEENFKLPRKYKIAFSNTESDNGNAKISDMGFVAVINEDNEEGFRLYGAGGLGNASSASIILEEFIKKEEVLYHVEAMKQLFYNHGDRTNKAKARIRHILKREGEENFRKMYQNYLNELKCKTDLLLNKEDLYEIKYNKNIGKLYNGNNNFVNESKIEGRYNIYVHPINGNIKSIDLNEIINYLSQLEYEISIRITSTQGFYLREIDGKNVEDILEIINKFSAKTNIQTIKACTGANVCQLGLCLSQNLSYAIQKRFEKEDIDIQNKLDNIQISGCPNSCGQHHKAKIGMQGKAKKVDGNYIPMYNVMFGGNLNKKIAELALSYGDLPAKAVPDFLVELAKYILKENYINIEDLLIKNGNIIKELIEKYSFIPSITEDENYYKDFGKEEYFSLKGLGKGEE